MLKPNLQCGDIRRLCLGEVIRSDGGALKNGISTLRREDSHLWNRKQAFLRYPICWCLDLGLPCLENCRSDTCLLLISHSVYSVFVIRNSNWGKTQWASGPGHLIFFKLLFSLRLSKDKASGKKLSSAKTKISCPLSEVKEDFPVYTTGKVEVVCWGIPLTL